MSNRVTGVVAAALLMAGACAHVGFPEIHRPAAETCGGVRPEQTPGAASAASAPMQGGANACQTDADCTGGKNGRCSGGGHEMQHCTYDACMSDADCKSSETCSCDSYGGNACLAANCRNDGDCDGRGCSPTRAETCGNMRGPTGFYCHTSHDDCTNDSECKEGDQGGRCVYRATVGHWACSFSMCVG